ncbi:MAG TPA: cytidine deaminase, partial [Desulfomicrobium sp.]|nr:cytidine deaminase [Desulfomicrobium sp.]
TQPCILCAKMLINCRVRAIHFAEGYPDDMSREMLDEAGIPYQRMERESDGR